MKFLGFLFIFVTIGLAYEIIPIIKHEQDVKYDGKYFYDFETENKIISKAVGNADEVKGYYKYISPDGTPIEVSYTAGVQGFQPTGDHIPTVPPHVLRTLEHIRTHPYKPKPGSKY